MKSEGDLRPLLLAIHAVMCEVSYVQKDGEVSGGGQRYRFASESAFIAKLRPAIEKHGLVVMPLPATRVHRETITKSDGKLTFRTLVEKPFVVAHTSGAWIELGMEGEGVDSSDKATGKACTQAEKWLLRQMFLIETGVDPDRESPEVTTAPQSAAYRAALQAIAGAADLSALNGVRSRITGSDKLAEHEKAALADAAESRRWEIENG